MNQVFKEWAVQAFVVVTTAGLLYGAYLVH